MRSLKVPVAENCSISPKGRSGLGPDVVIETRTAGVTTSLALPLINPEIAVTTALPIPWAAATPELLTAIIPACADVQLTELPRS